MLREAPAENEMLLYKDEEMPREERKWDRVAKITQQTPSYGIETDQIMKILTRAAKVMK